MTQSFLQVFSLLVVATALEWPHLRRANRATRYLALALVTGSSLLYGYMCAVPDFVGPVGLLETWLGVVGAE